MCQRLGGAAGEVRMGWPVIVAVIALLAALLCSGCGLFAEKPTKEAYRFGGEAIAWGAMAFQPQLMIPGVFKLVASSLWPDGIKGATPATKAERAAADELLNQVAAAEAEVAAKKKLAVLREELAKLKAAEPAAAEKKP